MEASQLIKFKELLTAINQINGVTSTNTFLFISGTTVTLRTGLSLYDLYNFDYMMVLGDYKWNFGDYTNQSAKFIGFFNKELELIDSIPVNEKTRIKGVNFTTYPGVYYNEYKPIFICEKQDGDSVSVQLDNGHGWSKDFQNLYNKVNEL